DGWGFKRKASVLCSSLEPAAIDNILKILDQIPQSGEPNSESQNETAALTSSAQRQTRTSLVKRKRHWLKEKEGHALTINYASHMMTRRLLDTLKENEHYLWRAWSISWGLIFILVLSVNLPNMLHWFLTHFAGLPPSTSPTSLIDSRVLGALALTPIFTIFVATSPLLVPTGLALAFLATNTWGQLALSLGVLLVGLRLATFFLKPNRIIADSKGLRAALDLGFREISFNSLDWQSLTSITLDRAEHTDPSKWLLTFHAGQNLLQIRLGGMDQTSKLSLFKTIEKYAPQVSRDADVETSLTQGSAQSFTDLWLSSLATPPKREKLAPLETGHILKGGQYMIQRQYSAGGQGLTYLAHAVDEMGDTNSEQNCKLIIKESMLPLYVDDEARRKAVERFEAEALLLKSLEHEKVVALVDYFIEDHRSYLVLERIAGLDLRAVMELKEGRLEGPFSAEEVLKLAAQMCDILQFLHGRTPPVVHRDFTPDNLVMDDQGNIKLIDFEVAHEHNQIQRTTATVVGKHAYIPPEQLRGKPEQASDLYALGATLYFLNTGHDPEPLSRSRLPELQDGGEPGKERELLSEIIQGLTALEPSKRLTLTELRRKLGLCQLQADDQNQEAEKQEEKLTIKVPQPESLVRERD
ncbi:MAG TPA: serine/threonine-protein kinase, partial [Candidatus Obscuribacter sp.]|nr:serine/threonine-protein kinase [Candidatus Obscuribacter sp.]